MAFATCKRREPALLKYLDMSSITHEFLLSALTWLAGNVKEADTTGIDIVFIAGGEFLQCFLGRKHFNLFTEKGGAEH